MKLFISWSGVRSRHIADSLRWWFPHILQAIRPFMSAQDIRKGARGTAVIGEHLEQAAIGIVCLTPENIAAPWILFESGALSKLTAAYVCTYLFELTPADVPPPVGQFQHTAANKAETFALVKTINEELKESGLDPSQLNETFEVWWPKLEERLKGTPARPEQEPVPEKRTEQDKLDELIRLVRSQQANQRVTTKSASGGHWVPKTLIHFPAAKNLLRAIYAVPRGQFSLVDQPDDWQPIIEYLLNIDAVTKEGETLVLTPFGELIALDNSDVRFDGR